MYIPTKFEENPVNGFREEIENEIVDGQNYIIHADL